MLEICLTWKNNGNSKGIIAQYYLCNAIDFENCNSLSSADAPFPSISPEQIVIQPVFDSLLMPLKFSISWPIQYFYPTQFFKMSFLNWSKNMSP